MRIREMRAQQDEIGLSRTLELVGTLYRYAGPYAEAVPPLDRALAIRNRLTPRHPDTASVLQVRGDVLFLRGDSAGAQKVWSTALGMAERTLGPKHPLIAEFLRRLGFAAFSAGSLDRGPPPARAGVSRRREPPCAMRSSGHPAAELDWPSRSAMTASTSKPVVCMAAR